jgi:glycosyltransferase involved in cell wall biosynthesis
MAAHNAESTILSAVRSALIAMGRGDELMVMLDNCSDGSLEELRRVVDSRLRIFSSSSKLGVAEARNELVRLSQKSHIAVLDADDLALPWRFWVTRHYLKRFDLVFGSAVVFGRALRPLSIIPQVPRRILNDPLEVLFRNPFVHSSAAFSREVFLEHGGYPKSISEDYCFWLKVLASNAKFLRSSLYLVLYRIHPGQYSSRQGFFERAEKDPILREAREELAKRLGLGCGSIQECLEFARQETQRKGLLARLELRGLKDLFRR